MTRGPAAPIDPVRVPDLAEAIRAARVAAPLREQVLDVLRQAILDFRLRPGQRLIERELTEQTGVSRTTIREVLRELAAEGLVTTIPQRGAIVMIPSAREAAELFEVRGALEALAARRFVRHADAARRRALGDRMRELERLAARRAPDTGRLLDVKDALSDEILLGADNTALRETLAGLRARVRLLRATSLARPGRTAEMVDEMRAIVAAADAGDGDAMAAACERHAREAARSGLRGLAELELDPDAAGVLAGLGT